MWFSMCFSPRCIEDFIRVAFFLPFLLPLPAAGIAIASFRSQHLALAAEVRQCPCQKECQNRCQIEPDRMSEYMPERMLDRMSECVYIYIYIYSTSRWNIRNYVRIVGQGGDHSKKVISLSGGLVEHVGRLLGNVGKTCAV